MIWLIGTFVFVSDAVIVWLQCKEREAWKDVRRRDTILLDGLGALAICVNIILVSELRWILVPFSVFGTMVGRWLAWRY